jgi:hypothetical protein
MKISYAFALAVGVAVAGCATSPAYQPSLPAGYAGPKATIRDTASLPYSSRANLFYLEKVDDRELLDSRSATMHANQGRGNSIIPTMLAHEVPARTSKFSVVALIQFAAPILALTNPAREVRGVVEFTPVDGKVYVVRGSLSGPVSAVWIEEAKTGEVMGRKVEVPAEK